MAKGPEKTTRKGWFGRLYMGLIIVLLYAPLVILIVCSFNASKQRSVWGGFTFHWYRDMIANEEIMSAVTTSLILTTTSALTACLIGTMVCVGMTVLGRKAKGYIRMTSNIPLLNADIVTGISIMILFAYFLSLGYASVFIAHVTLGLPYVILNVYPRIINMNNNIYEAALDLGASSFLAFRKVVFPEILPGMIAGFFYAFTISMDDFVVTYFSKGPGMNTISTMLYQQLRRGINPEMYALSTILFLAIIILLGIANRISQTGIEEVRL